MHAVRERALLPSRLVDSARSGHKTSTALSCCLGSIEKRTGDKQKRQWFVGTLN